MSLQHARRRRQDQLPGDAPPPGTGADSPTSPYLGPRRRSVQSSDAGLPVSRVRSVGIGYPALQHGASFVFSESSPPVLEHTQSLQTSSYVRRSSSNLELRIGLEEPPTPRTLVRTRSILADGDCAINYLRALVQSKAFSISMLILTLVVLFSDDLRLAGFHKEADKIFNGVTMFCIICFSVELVLSCVAIDDYFMSFFFLLDLFATVSLIVDITFIWDKLSGSEPFSLNDDRTRDDTTNQSLWARAARSSRLGTRVARVLRVFRLIRMARLFKVASWLKSRIFKPQGVGPGEGIAELGGLTDLANSESRVGRKLSDRTTLWVIVIVLAMMVVVPLLDVREEDSMMLQSAQYGADAVYQAWRDFLSAQEGLASPNVVKEKHQTWEEEVLMYIYYHSPFGGCPDQRDPRSDCTSGLLSKLCYFGYLVPDGSSNHSALAGLPTLLSITELGLKSSQWESILPGAGRSHMQYVLGELPQDIKDALASPWQSSCKIAGASVYGVSMYSDEPCPWKNLRDYETSRYLPVFQHFDDASRGVAVLVMIFDTSAKISTEAIFSIIRTIFIIIVIAVGAFLFSMDADNLVLRPLERMLAKVEIIRQDPLYAIKLSEEQYQNHKQYQEDSWQALRSDYNRALARMSGRSDVARPRPRKGGAAKREKAQTLETKILENTIIKLGSLLALGFGEAGGEIIGQNLGDDDVMVNAMIPGRKVEAIYGYCQIRDFSITTEVLQEKTMVFVNQVAEILHRIVDEHLGAANRNAGEAFLLVWRTGRSEDVLRSKMADLSVLSFVQVVVATNRDRGLAMYREHPALLARSSNYRVRLGFGLHIGWSIEGAIGSEFKVDASYISQHVSMAVQLESTAKQYGVTIIMSEALVRACTPEFAYYFRPIDHVKLSGGKTQTRLFTVDLDPHALFVDPTRKPRDVDRFHARRLREERKLEKLDDSYLVHELFARDRHVIRMRTVYSLEFFREFEKGYLNYEAGEWDVAVRVLKETAVMLQGIIDGPSCALLEYMRLFGYQAPASWMGFRDMTHGPLPSKNDAWNDSFFNNSPDLLWLDVVSV